MFDLAVKALKYCLLGLFGFAITCLLAAIVGAFPIIEPVMSFLFERLWRLLALILCLMATTVVFESIRQ